MTNTASKVEEAEFFLGWLRKATNPREFDFYLSAFIGAARSVLWVMKAEYGDQPGWTSWYNGLEPESADEALLKGTNDARLRAVKLGALYSAARITARGIGIPGGDLENLAPFVGRKVVGTLRGAPGSYTLEMGAGADRVAVPVKDVEIERWISEFPGDDVVRICTRYLSLLKSYVAECEAKFPNLKT